jgi:hypothetical protein
VSRKRILMTLLLVGTPSLLLLASFESPDALACSCPTGPTGRALVLAVPVVVVLVGAYVHHRQGAASGRTEGAKEMSMARRADEDDT